MSGGVDDEPLAEQELGVVFLLDLLQPLVVRAEVRLGLGGDGERFAVRVYNDRSPSVSLLNKGSTSRQGNSL